MKNKTKKSKAMSELRIKSEESGLSMTANEKAHLISAENDKRARSSTRKLAKLSGSQSDEWGFDILHDATKPVWDRNSPHQEQIDRTIGIAAAMAEIRPEGPIEGMLAAQMITVHNAAMASLSRASQPGVSPELYDMHMKHAGKLSKTFAALVEAMHRHRGKGEQRIVIERINVNAEQAIVGAVNAGGRSLKKMEGKAHEQVTYAPITALRSQESARDPLPISRNEKRPMPTARRQKHRSPER